MSVLPNVVAPIVALDLQGPSTLEEARRIRELDGSARVVLLADSVEPGWALAAIRLGVHGVVLKPDGLHTLPEVLRRVARGERVIPVELERAAVRELGRSVQRARAASGLAPSITMREREVLELLADGFTMRQIGRRLGISPRTAEAHVGRLYRKLTVRTRVQAIARGSALGLIELG
jgi:DNA-binding NarL/FixJ family response regulator